MKNGTGHPTSYTKVNSKWIKDSGITLKSTKPLEENIRGKLHDTGLGSICLIGQEKY